VLVFFWRNLDTLYRFGKLVGGIETLDEMREQVEKLEEIRKHLGVE
jgi:glutaredoxin-related protein